MKKKKIGVFKYSCCAGCQFQLIYFQKYVLETLEAVDFIYCRMLSSAEMPEGRFDVALIEGAITESWQADQLKKIREMSECLVPIGSCASCGGIPAIKNTSAELEVEARVYNDSSLIHSIKTHPVDHYVKVDGYIRGCPAGERDLTEFMISILLDKKPQPLEYCVCVECKIRNNICVLVAYKEPCLGPVTNAGCGALCPGVNRACYSCFGPMKDANSGALASQFIKFGLDADDVSGRFTEFGQAQTEFQAGALKKNEP